MAITLEELYPEATKEQHEEAQRRLEAYVRLVLRIQERLVKERVDASSVEA